MDRFLSMEAFVRVAQTRSFIDAARQLGVTRSVVSKRIQQLERFVDAPLFHRNTRHVRLSETGEAFFEQCVDLLAHASRVTEQMGGLRAIPAGKLRIQVLPGYAIDHFGPLLADFSGRYPDVQLDIVVGDRVLDPIEEGFDVAFQMFAPNSDSLIARPLFPVRRLFCAAPGYLAQRGAPQHPNELLDHAVAVYGGYPSRNHWVFEGGTERIEMDLPGQVRSNSVHLLRDYAVAGAGIVCLPTLVASAPLLAGTLQPLLTDFPLSAFQFSAVYPTTQRSAMKVGALVDFFTQRFVGEPEWDLPLLAKGWVV